MSGVFSKEKRKNLLRKRRYYSTHPEEANADHMKLIQTRSDDFILKKIEKWEKTHNIKPISPNRP